MTQSESLQSPVDTIPVKMNRYQSLDIARGIAMVFVVVIHVLEQLSSQEVKDSMFGGILNIGTSMGAATMFMFLMGTGLSFSRKTSLKTGILRGLILFAIAYGLNILRGTIPTFVGIATHQFTLESLKPYSPLYVTMEIDILHFAGLALIVLAIIKHLSSKWIVWLIAGVAILGVCPFVFGHKADSPIATYFINFLWRTEEYGHFPFFPWLAYPLFGMVFGHLLKNTKNQNIFFAKSCTIGIILVIIGGYMAYNYSDFTFESWLSGEYNEGEIHPWMVLCETGVLLVSLFFYQALVTRIPWNKAFEWLTYWSKEVTLLYCIQWVVIGWIVIFIKAYFGYVGSIIAMLFVFFISHLIAKMLKRKTTPAHK